MNLEREKRIEQRAYALWEAEGHPHGKHEQHWWRAASEIDAEETVRAVKSRSTRRTNGQSALNSGNLAPQGKKKRSA
jgi:hypothetical protein